MVDSPEEETAPAATPPITGSVGNSGDPINFINVEPFIGFSAEAGKDEQRIKVWTRLALTSDESLFHKLVENLAGAVNHMAQQVGVHVNLRKADMVLLILKSDATAELWLDTAAVSLQCRVKRTIHAHTFVFENDIVDVTAMSFPCIEFREDDKVLCLFREDWCFGLAFDMNPEGKLDVSGFTRTLGKLYRHLRYRHLYEAIGDPATFERLLTQGWFPFAEIITAEFTELLRHCEAGFDLSEIEEKIVRDFDDDRLDRMLERWAAKPHFAVRENLLKVAIDAFRNKQPIAVIKILLTEMEGVLNYFFREAHGGRGDSLEALLKFAEESADRKAGGSDTLLFPEAFGRYLRKYTFARFDAVSRLGAASSRHAVSHGAASQETYTMTRALQVILTLDQLAFYT